MNKTVRAQSKKVLIGVGVLALASVALFGTTYAAAPPQQPIHRNDALHQAIDTALANNDFAAFQSATANLPKPHNAPVITADVFAKMVEAHKLHLAGDEAGARKVMESLGFKRPPHQHHGRAFTKPTPLNTQS